MIWIYLILSLSFVFSSWSLNLILKTLNLIKLDLKNLTEDEKIEYGPFIRLDKGNLKLPEIVFCVYFLMPIRFLGAILALSTVLIVLLVSNIGIKKN
jgi:hypothetical protein